MRSFGWGIALLAFVTPIQAQVKLAPIFGTNMVLQRQMPVPVWGTASPDEGVTVQFLKQSKSTKADAKGKWSIKLDALEAGGPFEMTVKGKNEIKLANILVGEVWMCSGQSNMAWVLEKTEKAAAEIEASSNDMLRVNGGAWQPASPKTVEKFSAVAYYFGKNLQKALGVPVGVVNRSVGGTSARLWTTKDAIEGSPEMKPYVEAINDATKGKPGYLYDGLIRPNIPMAMRGVIWYQGESDASHPQEYTQLFQTMIKSWRQEWGQSDFPFLFVHLGAINKAPTSPDDIGWGPIREAQAAALKLPKTGLAEFYDSDVGIHPIKKAMIGERLALSARAIAYGEKNLVHSGPVLDKVEIQNNQAIVHYQHVGGGLKVKGAKLNGFAVAGADGKYVWAEAEIKGSTVVVSSKDVSVPVTVRYGFASNPQATLYNAEGLPAVPFRTDTTPFPDAPKKK